jgi:hypothetical protein
MWKTRNPLAAKEDRMHALAPTLPNAVKKTMLYQPFTSPVQPTASS